MRSNKNNFGLLVLKNLIANLKSAGMTVKQGKKHVDFMDKNIQIHDAIATTVKLPKLANNQIIAANQ